MQYDIVPRFSYYNEAFHFPVHPSFQPDIFYSGSNITFKLWDITRFTVYFIDDKESSFESQEKLLEYDNGLYTLGEMNYCVGEKFVNNHCLTLEIVDQDIYMCVLCNTEQSKPVKLIKSKSDMPIYAFTVKSVSDRKNILAFTKHPFIKHYVKGGDSPKRKLDDSQLTVSMIKKRTIDPEQ
jgi:hypothetical protein